MAYNLLTVPWIPWRRQAGNVEWGPPTLLVDDIDGNCVVDVATPRPDFNGAIQEFLIGLLTAALLPVDDDEWEAYTTRPPTPDDLRRAFEKLPSAFDLEGDGPRFFQDIAADEFADVRVTPIEQLFIDSPGENTTKLNKDLFVKRNRVQRVSRPVAAWALLTLQTYAPSGGVGHRTSLRGGGPLTTLVDPRVDNHDRSLAHERPLWEKLWANVQTQESLREMPSAVPIHALDRSFPWLRSTRTSKPKGAETPPASTHPLEAFFGMPRRIRLEFGDAGSCNLTGRDDARTVVGFRMRNYGVNYTSWQHPLTPYRAKAHSTEWLPMLAQPGGISWRDWAGLAFQADASKLLRPAAVVPAYTRRVGPRRARSARLHVFGYDMDNMKARGWTESILPLFIVDDEPQRRLIRETADQLSEATSTVAAALHFAVKAARFDDPKEASGDLGHVRTELWDATETTFYGIMTKLASSETIKADVSVYADELRFAFKNLLREEVLKVFDRWCPPTGLASEPLRRRVAARHDLTSTLNGYNKLGEQFFTALGVPLPGGGRAARAARKRMQKEAAP